MSKFNPCTQTIIIWFTFWLIHIHSSSGGAQIESEVFEFEISRYSCNFFKKSALWFMGLKSNSSNFHFNLRFRYLFGPEKLQLTNLQLQKLSKLLQSKFQVLTSDRFQKIDWAKFWTAKIFAVVSPKIKIDVHSSAKILTSGDQLEDWGLDRCRAKDPELLVKQPDHWLSR